jgi:EF-P beta-lysylation protein EpmB
VVGGRAGEQQFSALAPDEYLIKIRRDDPNDPLLRQILPLAAETHAVAGFDQDPLREQDARRAPGLLQKYAGRALLIMTGACAIHCRYCFRRHFDYGREPHSIAAWEPALRELENDSTIHEIILSGGDPLTLVDDRLKLLIDRLTEIKHLRRLRVHSRLPLIIPQRVTQGLLAVLKPQRVASWFVLHCNHPNELDSQTLESLTKLRNAGIGLLNQAVLLRGINDTVETQRELCERLVDHGILPYYLHQLDPVAGAAHFQVPIATGRAIRSQLLNQLSGYAVPRYVWEQPGGLSKQPL